VQISLFSLTLLDSSFPFVPAALAAEKKRGKKLCSHWFVQISFLSLTLLDSSFPFVPAVLTALCLRCLPLYACGAYRFTPAALAARFFEKSGAKTLPKWVCACHIVQLYFIG